MSQRQSSICFPGVFDVVHSARLDLLGLCWPDTNYLCNSCSSSIGTFGSSKSSCTIGSTVECVLRSLLQSLLGFPGQRFRSHIWSSCCCSFCLCPLHGLRDLSSVLIRDGLLPFANLSLVETKLIFVGGDGGDVELSYECLSFCRCCRLE
jgi:hypothetical protein